MLTMLRNDRYGNERILIYSNPFKDSEKSDSTLGDLTTYNGPGCKREATGLYTPSWLLLAIRPSIFTIKISSDTKVSRHSLRVADRG